MRKLKLLLLYFIAFSFGTLYSQEWKPVNGTKNVSNHYTLFKNANIYQADGTYLSDGQLLIRKNKIEAISKTIEAPKNTIVVDLQGKFIYPSFIELHADFSIPKVKAESRSSKPQIESRKIGPYYWNEAVKPEVNAFEILQYDQKAAEKYRKMGFGTILTHQKDGIIRGTSSLLNLDDQEKGRVIKEKASFHYSFYKGSSQQSYPSSLMGIIALIKQTLYDAKWYEENPLKTDFNASLKAINDYKGLPQFFDVESELSILRAAKIGKEFNIPFIIKGNGEEYKRIKEIQKTGVRLIVPINFPIAYDVSDPFLNRQLPLSKLKEWEMAAFNLRLLAQAYIPFTITSQDLESEKDFYSNITKTIENGFNRKKAIESLTSIPASFIGIEKELGSLEKNKLANFLIFSDTVFTAKSILLENWVDGKQNIINELPEIDIRGVYSLNINKTLQYDIEIKGELNHLKSTIALKNETEKKKLNVKLQGNRVNLYFQNDKNESMELIGSVNDRESRIWFGKALIENEWVSWGAIRKKLDFEKQSDSAKVKEPRIMPTINFPNMAYGTDSFPKAGKALLFRNATIWTNEKDGIVKNYDLLINEGKILMLGYKINMEVMFPKLANKVQEIDLKGKHLTTGIIDEHSHIAISRGVNESGQAVTAEVSIGDVVNSDDINIYRQLAGGVTTSQLLHGSANPIGGQSAIIKLRWGKSPEDMKVAGADGFIKFALGENVKQSNWGDHNTVRFPQTRMGVEQVFYDAFYRAKEYKADWQLYNAKSAKDKKKAIAPRYDLELNTLAEILDSNRFITCHSYIQSEINMLMHVADSMKFRVNTFTHILEGYKVADKMKKHGVAASTFSDWWAYKFEVNDAIPYNGAILHKQGVLTGFNSDDAEMGRRLNQEAAKAVKYGGVSEVEAWKFVTLNPAKMLHLDDRLGSIKAGKEADLVIWSHNPLSIYAIAEQVYIDGILYFDLQKSKELEVRDLKERERIIDLMLLENKKGKPKQEISKEEKLLYECETLNDL
ncbi:MAG: amidohydrolase family protein [Flavobacteriales bacterium]|nr:amidohydrolase family protein [Flavobacteriales bacterium]